MILIAQSLLLALVRTRTQCLLLRVRLVLHPLLLRSLLQLSLVICLHAPRSLWLRSELIRVVAARTGREGVTATSFFR